jgi:hypothetical protein
MGLAEQPIGRLGEIVSFFQGEVNQTVATARGFLTDRTHGPLVTRGANISRYQLREASQGEDIYIDVDAFLEGKGRDTKAFHHQFERVGLQESSPQNNFRRLISCRIPMGRFCNHKINYTTSAHSKIPLELVLFVLNSSFADWYFRLGSTNAAVSHYQLSNIPCPRLGRREGGIDQTLCSAIEAWIGARDFAAIERECLALASANGCNSTLDYAVVTLVKFIEAEECRRGVIARSDRSHLTPDAEKCQAVLDKLLLALLGIGSDTHEYIRRRLTEML